MQHEKSEAMFKDKLIQIDASADALDDAICEVCSHCGDLRMRNSNEDGLDEDDEYVGAVRPELRVLRQNFRGLQSSVDVVLRDHEKRLRALEKWLWLALGAGTVLGWLGGKIFGK